jgi:hypothetical protein
MPRGTALAIGGRSCPLKPRHPNGNEQKKAVETRDNHINDIPGFPGSVLVLGATLSTSCHHYSTLIWV